MLAGHYRRVALLPFWSVVWLCIGLLLLGGREAVAEPEPVLDVAVGHGGAVRPNHYFPIRVEISWVGKPGEAMTGDPLAARVEVRVPQDSVYSALLTRDVTIQPGKNSIAVVYGRSLADVSDIEVALRDSRGRLLVQGKVNASGMAGWWTIDDDQAIVMAVGKSTMPRSGWVFDHGNVSPVKVEEVKAADLPREWPGYDGVSLVLLEDLQPDRLDAIQIRTLLDWVRQGGQLAITVTNQLQTYRNVLGDLNWPISFDEYNSTEFNPALAEVLQGAIALGLDPNAKLPTPGRETLSVNSESAMGWYNQYLPTLEREIAAFSGRHLYTRAIELAPEAIESGWTVRQAEEWYNPLLTKKAGGTRRRGNIATGPYGLGSITLVGVDPASLAGGGARELRGVGWWHCLSHVGSILTAVSSTPPQSGAYYGGYRSVDATLATTAVNDIIDKLSAPFGISHGLFGAISIALLLLVLLIGPVDYFVLRWTSREPLTWITCPILVLLACGAIYFAQESVSYGRARASRTTIVDAWSGAAQGTATSFTAISSARGGRYAIDGLGAGVWQTPTCWNPPYWYYYGDETSTTTTPIRQGSSGASVVSIGVPLENVRWLQERGPIDLPEITGAVRFDRARDRVEVDVNAPAGWSGRVVAVEWNEGWYRRESVELSSGRVAAATIPRDPGDRDAAKLRKSQGTANSWGYYQTDWVAGWVNDLSFQIPGHREIGKRLAALGPEYAAILISFDHRSDVELTRDGSPVETEWSETLQLRLIVPAQPLAAEAKGNEP